MKRKQKGKLILGFLAAIVVLGIGYAIVTSLNMSIGGNASVKPNGELKVTFVQNDATETAIEDPEENAIIKSGELANGTPMEASNLTATVDSDTEATFAITELNTVGDFAEFTYNVVNESNGIDAELSFDVSNSNNQADYFNITKSVDKTVIGKDEIAKFKVKVELIKSPKIEDVQGTFTITLTATPKEEGTVTDQGPLSVSEKIVEVSTKNDVTRALKDPDVSEIVLEDDIDYGGYAVSLPANQDVTIDLNGNELKTMINVKGDLTIEDSSRDGSGTLKAMSSYYAMEVAEGGNVVMNSGEINAPGNYGVYLNGGNMTINDGVINSKYAVISSNNTTGTMDLTINGGTFTSQSGSVIYMPTPKSLTINDGTLNGGIVVRMGDITINGGTINSTPSGAWYGAYIDGYNYSGNAWFGDAITVIGGTYTASNGGSNTLNLKITGGTLNSVSGGGTALGILNLGKVAQEMNVDITGGTFKTTATNRDTFEIKYPDDIGEVSAAYKAITNHVNVSITGGNGLTGITTSGTY